MPRNLAAIRAKDVCPSLTYALGDAARCIPNLDHTSRGLELATAGPALRSTRFRHGTSFNAQATEVKTISDIGPFGGMPPSNTTRRSDLRHEYHDHV